MADLITPQEYAQINDAFSDVYDTFFKYIATIYKRARKPDKLKNGLNNTYSTQEIQVRCLPKHEKTGTDAENLIIREGNIDFTESIMIFAVQDLLDAGLYANNNTLLNPVTDSMALDGVDYEIMGITNVGPLNGGTELVYFHVKRKMK